MKLGQNMDVDDLNVYLEGQGHRSKVKVIRSKEHDFRSHFTVLQVMFKGDGSGSKVMCVKDK